MELQQSTLDEVQIEQQRVVDDGWVVDGLSGDCKTSKWPSVSVKHHHQQSQRSSWSSKGAIGLGKVAGGHAGVSEASWGYNEGRGGRLRQQRVQEKSIGADDASGCHDRVRGGLRRQGSASMRLSKAEQGLVKGPGGLVKAGRPWWWLGRPREGQLDSTRSVQEVGGERFMRRRSDMGREEEEGKRRRLWLGLGLKLLRYHVRKHKPLIVIHQRQNKDI